MHKYEISDLLTCFQHFVGDARNEEIKLIISQPQDKKSTRLTYNLRSESLSFVYTELTIEKFRTIFLEEFCNQLRNYMLKIFKKIEIEVTSNFFAFTFDENTGHAVLKFSLSSGGLQKLKTISTFDWRVFDKTSFDFEVVGFKSNDRKIRQLNSKSCLIDAYITRDGYVVSRDRNNDFYIFWKPIEKTYVHHSKTKEYVQFVGDHIVQYKYFDSSEEKVKPKTTEKPKVVFMHVSYRHMSVEEIKSILEKYKADRIIDKEGKMWWIDQFTNTVANSVISKDDQTLFDEATKTNVRFLYSALHPRDPRIRATIGPIDANKALQYGIDIVFTDIECCFGEDSDRFNGEYIDYITKEKFKVNDGKVIRLGK